MTSPAWMNDENLKMLQNQRADLKRLENLLVEGFQWGDHEAGVDFWSAAHRHVEKMVVECDRAIDEMQESQ